MAKVSEIMDENRSKGNVFFAIDGAALFEAGAKDNCDAIIAVIADWNTRLQRVVSRDSIDKERAEKRFEGQKDEKFYTSRADHVIVNEDLDELNNKIADTLNKL